MTEARDKELINKAKSGDEEAFGKLFDRYGDRVLNFLYRFMGDYQKAEDVLLETFHEVYKRLPAYREEGKFLGWIFTIAINRARNALKKKWNRELLQDAGPAGIYGEHEGFETRVADESLRPDYELIGKEVQALVQECLKKIDRKYREILVLCDIEGLSYEEVADILKCSVSLVGVRLHRARQELYNFLREAGYDV